MTGLILLRNYTTGWYTLKREDAINGLISDLSERKGVRNICVNSCYPAQLEGDKGYKMGVSYQEDLDETFGFTKNIDKVIFLDVDSYLLPYDVRKVALETQSSIVIAAPSLKDNYFDVGNIFPTRLAELMEDSNKNGVQIVGITPSINSLQYYYTQSSNMLEISIIRYLKEHPSIQNFLIVSEEELQDLSSHLIKCNDIWSYEERAKTILNGKELTKEKRKGK